MHGVECGVACIHCCFVHESLSGDVYFNPSSSCGICDEDKAMCCDSCVRWLVFFVILTISHWRRVWLVGTESFFWLLIVSHRYRSQCLQLFRDFFFIFQWNVCISMLVVAIYHKHFDLAAWFSCLWWWFWNYWLFWVFFHV